MDTYKLGIYQPWPVWTRGSFIGFWDKQGGDAAAVFIDRASEWNDTEYAIWHGADRVSVRFVCAKDATRWPLARGTRSTGLSFYSHRKDIERMQTIEQLSRSGIVYNDGKKYTTNLFAASYGQYLQNRYGTIDLDLVKDWVLAAGEDQTQTLPHFTDNAIRTHAELEQAWRSSSMIEQMALFGTRQNSGFSPVPGRAILDCYLPAYSAYRSAITASEKRHIEACFLANAYMANSEDYMPMVSMLSGHPNFLSDVRSIPAAVSTLFPHHPKAEIWQAMFEKYLDLNTHYHTRPSVKQWQFKGGRWTENIGTYVWGFL
ncbi:MAG: hypothetical protein P4K83_01360 [Terracidiphilus sp.]|nr:hypothetical protein [Terracidiphilus sp.]